MAYEIPVEPLLGKILEGIRERGWNAYKKSCPLNDEGTIVPGPAQTLEVGASYILFPLTEDSSNPEAVLGALERVAVKLNRQMPTITIGGVPFEITGFTPCDSHVHLHVPEGLRVNYETMLSGIRTLVDANP